MKLDKRNSGFEKAQPPLRRPWARRFLLLTGACYVGAWVGHALTPTINRVEVIWPPSGILLAALLVMPRNQWGRCLAAAAVAHLLVEIPLGLPVWLCCWRLACTGLMAVLPAWAIGQLVAPPFCVGRLRDVTIYTLTVFASTALVSLLFPRFVLAAAALFAGTESAVDFALFEEWRRIFLASFIALLLITPVIVAWATPPTPGTGRRSLRHSMEAALLGLGLFLVCGLFVIEHNVDPTSLPELLYAILPFFLWAALRFGIRGASSVISVVALAGIWLSLSDVGMFGRRPTLETVVFLQLFLVVTALPLLLLAVVVEERRRAQAALRESEELYREVVEIQNDMVCRYTADTTLTFVNGAYCRFFGLSSEQLIGRRFVDLIPAAAREGVLAHVATLARTRALQSYEHEVTLPDGSVRWQQWMDYVLVRSDGSVGQYQGIGRDITDRKRAEEAQRNLAHASRLAMAGELTASIAHEINQPLGAILSNVDAAEMLLDRSALSKEKTRDILQDIRKDDLRAGEIIAHLRSLLCKREMELQPLDLNQIVAEVLRLTASDLQRRHIRLELRLTPVPPRLLGDRVHLQQVLLNLILNAMDAMAQTPPPRCLTVRTAHVGRQQIEVTVHDTGRGIPADQLPRIFDSFFTTKKEGMGLGLSIVRSLVEAHEGTIIAANHADGGAMFRITLPAQAAREP